jgi:hypothetical protein
MLETLISIFIRGAIAGWIFYDAYNKRRYKKGPSITWTIGALVSPILLLLFYLLFRPLPGRIFEKGVGKVAPEFMAKKYRLLDNALMVVAAISCGIIIFLLGNVIPTFTKMFQEAEISLSVVCKISLILGHWIWAIGILLLIGIVLFFKHPRLVRFHRRHAPRSYAIYITAVYTAVMFRAGIIVGWIVRGMYLPIFEMSAMIE